MHTLRPTSVLRSFSILRPAAPITLIAPLTAFSSCSRTYWPACVIRNRQHHHSERFRLYLQRESACKTEHPVLVVQVALLASASDPSSLSQHTRHHACRPHRRPPCRRHHAPHTDTTTASLHPATNDRLAPHTTTRKPRTAITLPAGKSRPHHPDQLDSDTAVTSQLARAGPIT